MAMGLVLMNPHLTASLNIFLRIASVLLIVEGLIFPCLLFLYSSIILGVISAIPVSLKNSSRWFLILSRFFSYYEGPSNDEIVNRTLMVKVTYFWRK